MATQKEFQLCSSRDEVGGLSPLHPRPQNVLALAPTAKLSRVWIMIEQVCVWQEGHGQGGWVPRGSLTVRRKNCSLFCHWKINAHATICFSCFHDFNYLLHQRGKKRKRERRGPETTLVALHLAILLQEIELLWTGVCKPDAYLMTREKCTFKSS